MAKSKIIVLCVALLMSFQANAQQKRYFLQFKDKAQSPYSLSKPEEFLSKRSVERRVRQNIKLTQKDLPVNPSYIEQIIQKGAKIIYTSKWMNGALVECKPETLQEIEALSFVRSGAVLAKARGGKLSQKSSSHQKVLKNQSKQSIFSIEEITKEDYGTSYVQVNMLGVDKMHQQGYLGQGLWVAIFDAGFRNTDQIIAFKHLFENKRILGTYDVVANEKSVFEDDDHGTMVLSCMAAYEKGQIIGTAPEASYLLIRSEDANSEYRIEEYNWLRAAEYADSVGVDIINSSLGYNSFDDKSMNYSFKDMDGKTTIITQAAEYASNCGMVVVTSAGNEGGNLWGYITAPADASSVLSIGAVNARRRIAYFSSHGNTADGRIKPDLVALGSGSVIVDAQGNVTTANGTSFSSPILAGLVAGFWQAYPELTSKQVVDLLRRSGDQVNKPDSLYGYGVADFNRAQYLVKKELSRYGLLTDEQPNALLVYPNPVSRDSVSQVKVAWGSQHQGKSAHIYVYDANGKQIKHLSVADVPKETILYLPAQLQAGEYIVKVKPVESETKTIKIIVQ